MNTRTPSYALKLSDLEYYDIGNKIQLYGAIYSDGKTIYLLPLPDEDANELGDVLTDAKTNVLVDLVAMDEAEWERFLRQTDVLDVQGPAKAILRKSQRQIDQAIAWKVYERDGYRCRYCGRKAALTVDHVILWEEGGVSVADNLISACRRCNKLRGNMQYEDWLDSKDYARLSKDLDESVIYRNAVVLEKLPKLQALKVAKQRSR